MKSEDDPEARIRELEQPLTDAARASEAGSSPQPSKWAPPSGPPYQPPPLPYGGSLPGPSMRTVSSGRVWWIVAAVFVIGMIALPAGIMLFTAHKVSHSGTTTFAPLPDFSMSSTAPSSAKAQTPSAAAPSIQVPGSTAPISENVIVSGINENRTIVCNQNTVNVSGISNTVVITGHCTRLTVSGVQNKITVESADSIEASGFTNQVTYHNGAPHVEESGQDNAVHQG